MSGNEGCAALAEVMESRGNVYRVLSRCFREEVDVAFASELADGFAFESDDAALTGPLGEMRGALAGISEDGIEQLAVTFDRVFFGMGPLTASGFYGALADFTIVFIRADIQPIAEMLGQDA